MRPARAAQRQNGRVGADRCRTFGRIEEKAACLVPARPSMAQLEADAGGIELPEPGAQQRRGFHRLGKHPPARSHERFLTQRLAPRAQSIGRKGLDRRAKARLGGSIAPQKCCQLFAMGQIEPAAPRQEKLAADGGHALVDGHGRTATGGNFRRHQAGGAATDDGDVLRQSSDHRY